MKIPSCNCHVPSDISFHSHAIIGEQHMMSVPMRRLTNAGPDGCYFVRASMEYLNSGTYEYIDREDRPYKVELRYCPLCGKPFKEDT